MTDPRPTEAEQLQAATSRRITVATIAALIALLSSGVAAVFTLWPELRPDPRSNREGEISVFAVERGVPYGAYLKRTSPLEGPPREGNLADPKLEGEVVYVRARVRGFKRSSVLLRWSIYDAASGQQSSSPDLKNETSVERTLETPTDSFVQPIWLPPTYCIGPGVDRYFVRIELLDEDGRILAIADSDPFRGLDC